MVQAHAIAFGPFRLETPPGRLWRGDQVLPLRPRSLAMLRYLVAHPGLLVTKAEVQQHVRAGTHVSDSVLRVEAGLIALAEAVTLVATTAERWWKAEVYRLQGALLLQLPSPDICQAEGCFRQALDVACRQQAKALESRAALSLSRLWQQQGQRAAARQLPG